ncbi:ABC transporter permease [Sphaerotilus mobilis]|uniref:Iron(III) transport system permease protein n=1 Tax=Sphaerotilus mobilis TaxID=47994 RepID=A0A4Q7LJE3_9BURK|nr:iron ABC transporter permease [Sphaerotilus mobilis]RZS54705.1 iron(III) transport system permease protein [Sphaerotilus mobilis]
MTTALTLALVVVGALALAQLLARRGAFGADRTVATIVVLIATLLLLFIFYPVGRSLGAALFDDTGAFAPWVVMRRLAAPDIWGLGCLSGAGVQCGVAINSIVLASLVGLLSTLLGLVLALAAQRGHRDPEAQRRQGALFRLMAVLPIVTPPFVIALALVVLFGRTGLVTGWLSSVFEIPRSRWIYGLTGVTLAQLLSFTPIAFMMLHAALAAISPSLEEAAQTLRASRWRVMRTVTWPLLRPALANAFLLGFVESMADFANPIVLAGNYEVLSTKIFFAVAGAQHDPGRAAVLAAVLLAFTLAAFALQQRWLGRASYVSVTGKGDGGLPAVLPDGLRRGCVGLSWLWIGFTLACYAVIAVGGFVKDIGRGDMTLSLKHLGDGFGIDWGPHGLLFSGSAWDSFFTTVTVAGVAAPLTAIVGLLSAYVITRHRFAGRGAFEFLTLVAFAVPGTVIGVAYIVAFNVPPLELTGGMAILVICFVFRNMPVGVRAGVAALAQIDRSLDEASSTLRAGTLTTLRRVVIPLLRPAIVTTLVFSFTHAMTAVSAVIFLATAKYNLATVYIIGRVEAGEYPLAIAYSTVLIFFMLAVLLAVQALTGETRIGRRQRDAEPAAGTRDVLVTGH